MELDAKAQLSEKSLSEAVGDIEGSHCGVKSCFLHQGYPNAAIPIPHKFLGISTNIDLSV